MAKAKKSKKGGEYVVDFDDYEPREGGYDGDVPKKGTYDGTLFAFREHTSSAGNEGFEWIFEISDGPYKGWRGWVYSNMDTSKWKTQQIVAAISGEEKVTLKPDSAGSRENNSTTVKAAKPVRLVLRREPFEDEVQAKISRVLPVEESEKKSKKGKKKKDEEPF